MGNIINYYLIERMGKRGTSLLISGEQEFKFLALRVSCLCVLLFLHRSSIGLYSNREVIEVLSNIQNNKKDRQKTAIKKELKSIQKRVKQVNPELYMDLLLYHSEVTKQILLLNTKEINTLLGNSDVYQKHMLLKLSNLF